MYGVSTNRVIAISSFCPLNVNFIVSYDFGFILMSNVTWCSEICIESTCLFAFVLMGWLLPFCTHSMHFFILRIIELT